ncbi:MAG: DUF3574 domain-containing protein [Gammaproteobacteria bacterium]
MTIRRTSNTLFISLLLGLSLTYGSAYADQSKPTISDSPAVALAYRDAQAVCSAPLSGEPFARTELFFGLSKSDGSTISALQFRRFLRDTATPLFPDGLTVLSGLGQFKDPSGRIIREGARLVILLYPLDAAGASEEIDAIREAYKEKFEQQSVLRTDTIDCVSF